MQRFKTSLVVLLIMLISLCSFISCKNASDYINGSEVTIIEPSFDTATGEEKELIEAKIEITKYQIKMVPNWAVADKGVPIYGRTDIIKGNDNGYIEIDATKIHNLGYFTQGIWTFGLKAYNKDTLVYTVEEKQVEINSNKKYISIDASEIKYADSNASCSVYLNDCDLLLVDSFDKYCSGEEYKVTVSIIPISTGGTTIDETIIQFTNGMQHTDEVAKISNIDVTSNDKIKPGTYVLSVYFYQKINGSWVKDGGVSYGFTAIPGATLPITLKEDIDLYPHKFKSVGTSGSGIIIDSGINADVSITPSVSGTVNVDTTVTFTGNVNNIETSGYWIVNGDKSSMQSGKTFTYTPTTSNAGKTVTITYMVLDSSYNTISANYYLSVNAST